MPNGRLSVAACLLVAALFASGCKEDFGTDPNTPTSIEAFDGNDQSATVASSLPQPLTARVTGSGGGPIAGISVSWSVTDGGGSLSSTSGVTDAAGLVETTWTLGTGAGEQGARATVPGVSGAASYTATALPGPAVSVGLSPDDIEFTAIDQTLTIAASGQDEYGNDVADASGSWSSTNTSVATVSGEGEVTSEGPGQAEVRFTGSAGSASAAVTVSQEVAAVTLSSHAETLTALGATVDLGASVTDANGYLIDGVTPTWTSRSPGVATVDGGLVTAVSAGTTWIVAEAGSHADSAEITVDVQASSIAEVNVSPGTLAFEYIGEALELTAEARDENGDLVPDASFEWSSSNTTVATVDGSGLVTAHAQGSTAITATAGGVSSEEVAVTVDQVPAEVSVSPTLLVVGPGGEGAVTIEVVDQGGTVIPGADFTMASGNVGVVSASGTSVTGVATGVADVVVTSGDASASARVAVVAQDGFAFVATPAPEEAFLTAEPGSMVELDLWLIRPEGGTGGLGSISGSLNWNSEVLEFQSSEGLASGFSWTPNDTEVASGRFSFGSYAAEGLSADIHLARVTLRVMSGATAGWESTIRPEVSAAGNADGSTNITDLIQVVESHLEVQP